MQEPETWRELLRGIISDGHEKQRIADELGISPITLTRWANRESDPRQQNLRLLLKALPQHREMLLELIPKEFDDFTAAAIDDSTKEIPSAFYARVFIARGSTAEALRFWSICNLILQQALGQLDPDRLGMAVNVVRCMPPKNGKVR
ncbi:MAG: helix-turn-helix transcriptional regulator, partial [Ktedonobacteraceae bacterium]|nr:helix-turn-helix transcriptional regulator [Ktedonobacteraceae bacterium]